MSAAKRFACCMLVIALLMGCIPPLGAGRIATAAEILEALSPVLVSAVNETYESGSVNDPIFTSGNYNVTVQEDPEQSGNKVAKQTYGSAATSGFGPEIPFAPLTGTVVFDQKVRLEGSANSGTYYGVYLRTEIGNLPVLLWRLQYPGSSPSLYLTKSEGSGEENAVPANTIQMNAWYSIRTVIHTDLETFDTYLFDAAGNRVFGSIGRLLPAMSGTSAIDYSAGFKKLYTRHGGSTATSAATYSDDVLHYSISNATHAGFLVDQAETGWRKAEIQYADGKVAAMDSGAGRTALETRLSDLRTHMLADAEAAVEAAELSRLEADLVTAGSKLAELPDDVDTSDLQDRLDELAANIDYRYVTHTYEDLAIDATVHTGSGYDISVSADPEDAGNKVARMKFGTVNTSGFWNGRNFSPAIQGTVVFEKRLRFEGTGNGLYDLQTFRTQDSNQSVNLFRVQGPGNASGVYVRYANGSDAEERLASGSIVNDRWYRIIAVMHLDAGTYDLYIIDESGSEVIQQSTGRMLQKVIAGHSIDYSQGIRSLSSRFYGTAASLGAAALYVDDERLYGNTAPNIADQIEDRLEQIRENTLYYSAGLQERLNESIVLYPERAYGYVHNKRRPISPDHPEVRPERIGGTAMAPVEFLGLHMGLTGAWDSSGTVFTAAGGGTTVQLEAGLSAMTVNGLTVPLEHTAIQRTNALLVPVGNFVEAFGLSLYQDDDRNVWAIDAEPALFDPVDDAALLDELADARYGTRKPAVAIQLTAPAPADVAAQEAAFEDRNSIANLEALALRLADELDPTVAALADFRQSIVDEEYTEALEEFRTYFLNKLANLDEMSWDQKLLSFTMSSGDSMPDELLFDVVTAPDKRKIAIGAPGLTNWQFEAPESSQQFAAKNNYMWHIDQFFPLLNKYNATGNLSFLDKWAAFVDDWSLHSKGYDSILPAEIPDADQAGARAVVYLLKQLRLLAANLPEDGEGLPASTLARVLLKMQQEYPPISIVYGRSNPQNWTTGIFSSLIMNGRLLSEFKMSAVYLREGLRRMEDYGTTNSMPDGTDSEQSISYNREDLFYGAGLAYRIVMALSPELMPPEREAEIKERLMARAKLMAHTLTTDGAYPAGFRIDLRDWIATVRELLEEALPEALEDPDIAAILATASGVPGAPTSSFKSEWFPYGGYTFIREGWGPDSQEAFLFSSSQPGNYGFHSKQGNNMLSIRAFGQDMIVPGEVGAYDNLKSPVLIDGLSQNDYYGISSWGHRQLLVSAWDEPADLRWYDSSHFTFSEGLYDRYYGEAGMDDVDHQRMLNWLQDEGLWIVTDRMIGGGTHTYRMDLRLPVKDIGPRSNGYKAFDSAEIELETIDANATAARTQDPGIANLSVYQFGSASVTTTGTKESVSSDNLYKVSDFYKLSAAFSGTGDQALVTVVYPRSTMADELVSITPLNGIGVAGFSAELPDGKLVQYRTAADKNELLSIGSVAIQGEALLLVTGMDGFVKGMALGAQVMSIGGTPQTISFEFEIRDGVMQQVGSVHKPVGEVSITPGADVFVGSVSVEMATATADASIRYTLDGSEPTLSSPLYAGPVALTETTTVKARAFRAGTTSMPVTASGTEASSVRTAKFTKKALREAAEPTTVGGVEYAYYEGDWKDMMVRMDRIAPTATGTASGLFDFSAKATDGAYAFEYSGWLEVPESGVYTFRAPEEWLKPNIMAGYDLQLYIGDEQWYPITGRQSFGTWSIALEAGKHPIRVRYVDYRGGTPAIYNDPALTPRIWEGTTPELTISGPGLTEQAIPASLLSRES